MRTNSPLEKRYGLMVANLLRLYRSASPAAVAAGKEWYSDAHAICVNWSESYRLPLDTIASVVAAISPRCEWNRNLIIADDVLAERPASVGGALHACLTKARGLRAGTIPDIAHAFPKGPKVNCFAANLAGDFGMVTVDTHAAQAALNAPTWFKNVTMAKYAVITRAYMTAAQHVGVMPAEFQAIIWHAWKERYSREQKRERQRKERLAA